MCGIAGEFATGGTVIQGHFVREACQRLVHRGPDEVGEFRAAEIALGISRLRVVGIDNGSQPVLSAEQDVVAVMNGEIYNFRHLRERLVGMGHQIDGASDAGVLPAMYLQYGEAMVDHLSGMFAIAIYDQRSRCLLLFTDRVGKKPLFYARTADRSIVFASELQALVVHPGIDVAVNPQAVDNYLSYRVIPAPTTIYRGVHKVLPASVLTISEDGEETLRCYWSFDFSDGPYSANGAGLVDQLEDHLMAEVGERLTAEVPLGSMLSGGLDSSLVVAMAKKQRSTLHTFSVGFDHQAFDETTHAREVAEYCGTEHHDFRITAQDARRAIDPILQHMGEPYAFPSAIASYFMFELASNHVTVVLTGDGSDEIFAGYNRYKIARRLPEVRASDVHRVDLDALAEARTFADRYKSVLVDGLRIGLKRKLYSKSFSEELASTSGENYVADRFARVGWKADELNVMMQVDTSFWLPDAQLVKIDRMAMAHSVEPRSPFLATQVIEFAQSVDPAFKLQGDNEKIILKRVAERYLPDSIVHRRKQELAVPLESWMATHLRTTVQQTLLSDASLSRGYFQPNALRSFVEEFHPNDVYSLWTLFMLERWHELHVDATSPALEFHE